MGLMVLLFPQILLNLKELVNLKIKLFYQLLEKLIQEINKYKNYLKMARKKLLSTTILNVILFKKKLIHYLIQEILIKQFMFYLKFPK